MGEAPTGEDSTVTRSAEYVGCFPVDDCCLDEQIEHLHRQLKELRKSKIRRAVSLKFSVKGVKIYDEDETRLLMAHALQRISLSTARPSDSQFAFVSHNPGCRDAQLYCHLFKARHARAAQFLNLLLCRCFQLLYLERHPEEASQDSVGSLPRRKPSLLNHGFPLSVSALVSFRRAPFRGLFPGAKSRSKTPEKKQSPRRHKDEDKEAFVSVPSLVRKKAIRNKGMRSGAYRSFTFTPLKQRDAQERLASSSSSSSSPSSQGKDQDGAPGKKAHTSSLAETEEALAQAVWCWAGIAPDCSSALLEEDVLGSYLLCPHPKKPNCGSLQIRLPSGLVTYLLENTRKGMFHLEKCKAEFVSVAVLMEHYTESQEELPSRLSCARVNHCYEWEEEEEEEEAQREGTAARATPSATSALRKSFRRSPSRQASRRKR